MTEKKAEVNHERRTLRVYQDNKDKKGKKYIKGGKVGAMLNQ